MFKINDVGKIKFRVYIMIVEKGFTLKADTEISSVCLKIEMPLRRQACQPQALDFIVVV